jgi:hypothetical protein
VKIVPLAVDGRWRTVTMPQARTRRPLAQFASCVPSRT